MDKQFVVVQDEMWAGTQVSFLLHLERLRRLAARGDSPEMQAGFYGTPAAQAPSEEPLPYLLAVQGNVAVIEVKGPMTNQTNYYDKYDKAATYPAIREALVAAANMDAVTQIMLDIDSGGGAVSGLADVGTLVQSINKGIKPVTAFTDGNMMSAAYWLGASAGKVYMSKAAGAGSIGVIATHMEVSKMYADMGVNATVMRAGKWKALANRFEPLTDAAKTQIQDGLDAAYGVFVQHVADSRKTTYATADATMAQGREFFGETAVSAGLADGISTFDKVMGKLTQKGVDSQKSFSQNSSQINKGPIAMKTALTEQQIAAIAAGAPQTAATGTVVEGTADGAVVVEGSTETVAVVEPVAAAAAAVMGATGSDISAFLQSQVADKDKTILANGVELAQLRSRVVEMEAAQSGLITIAAKSVNNMRIALGGSAIDLSATSAVALLAEHKSFEDQFAKRFVAGGVAAVDAAVVKVPEASAQVDSLTAARLAAVNIQRPQSK